MITGCPCGGPRLVERAAHLEKAAVVVERPHLVGVDVETGLLVGDDRIVLPAIPQPPDDIDKFLRPRIAQLVF
jgi:hypothetical protein